MYAVCFGLYFGPSSGMSLSCIGVDQKLAASRYFSNRIGTYPLEKTEKEKEI